MRRGTRYLNTETPTGMRLLLAARLIQHLEGKESCRRYSGVGDIVVSVI